MAKHKNIQILLIEDEHYDVRRIKNTIEPYKDKIFIRSVVASGQAALSLLKDQGKHYDVVIMDFQIAGGLTGENLIREIKSVDPTLQIIVVTKMTINITDFDFAHRLLEAGAMWYCTKYPVDIEDYIYQPTDFILSIFNAFEKRSIERAKLKSDERLLESIDECITRNPIIGDSAEIKELKKTINKYAETDGHVLISGHSGTGKELVAKHIHFLGSRRFEKFIPINCGSLPEELIESELFGYEKGSFTGANSKKPGLFELANNGTIFLDEIAELSKQAQVKLLRVIQEGELDKIGRTKKVKVNVRIIAATNKNLVQEINEKRFRDDLFYRLNVFTIQVPELKHRRSDIPVLVNYFLGYFSRDMGRELPSLPENVMDVLSNYNWPGNVRQLQNVVQRLLISDENSITEKNVLNSLGIGPAEHSSEVNYPDMCWNAEEIRTWHDMEKTIKTSYFQYVRKHSKSDAEAARKLGLDPPNYHRICKKLGLK